jgi:hypothetical protein
MRLQRELQVEAEQEAGAREFERSLAALERQRDVVSIVNGMLKFGADEAIQKAACRSLLHLTPSVESDEYQKIRSQDGEAWAQMRREYRALASVGVVDVVCRAISAHSAEVACAGCYILTLLARDAENQRKIGAQVANAHAYKCALPEENVAIGNHKHTHSRTHTEYKCALPEENVARAIGNRKHTHSRTHTHTHTHRGGSRPWSRRWAATPRVLACRRRRPGPFRTSPAILPRTSARSARR